MAFTKPEKAFCVLEFAKTESWTLVQRVFRTKFQKGAPERKSTLRWHGKFMKNGCLCPDKRTGRPSTSDDAVERVRTAFERTFHVNGKVNKHNTRIWGTENPHEILEHQRDSPKVTECVLCIVQESCLRIILL